MARPRGVASGINRAETKRGPVGAQLRTTLIREEDGGKAMVVRGRSSELWSRECVQRKREF